MDDEAEKPVTAVERVLFTPLYYPRNAWSVIRWWESRRLFYNGVVGSAGLLTLGTIMLVTPAPWTVAVVGPLIYGAAANFCYSIGAFADLALRRMLGERAPAVGPVLYRYGLAFSVGLTLLPIPLFLFGTLMDKLF